MEDNNFEFKHPYVNRRRRSIIRDFFHETSIHGLPAIGRAYNQKNLCCWSVVFCVFFGVMLYFVITSILTYFTYPTQTNVDIIIEYPMLFPAITVCNYAVIRYDLIIGPFTNFTNSIGLASSNTSAALDFSNPTILAAFDKFIFNILNEGDTMLNYVFDLTELLFSCTYNGLKCNAGDFVQVSFSFIFPIFSFFSFFLFKIVRILELRTLLYIQCEK